MTAAARSLRVIPILVLAATLSAAPGCTWVGPDDLPRLERPFVAEYRFDQPPGRVWQAMLDAVDERRPGKVLVRDPLNRLVSWTEMTRWQRCNRSIRYSSNPATVALTVAHLFEQSGETWLSLRTSCFIAEDDTIEHGRSLGEWEGRFAERVRRLLGGV